MGRSGTCEGIGAEPTIERSLRSGEVRVGANGVGASIPDGTEGHCIGGVGADVEREPAAKSHQTGPLPIAESIRERFEGEAPDTGNFIGE